MLTHLRVESLDERQCRDLLLHGRVGRVALSIGALPAIVPVRYMVQDGSLVFEAATGVPLMGGDQHILAFEAGDIDVESGAGWSVQAVGMAERLDDVGPDGGPLYRLALEVISGNRMVA